MSELIPDKSLYLFAYGSCMSQHSLTNTLGDDSRRYFVSSATLAHHRLCFNYTSLNEPVCCANISPALGSSVQGALYRLPEQLMTLIDRREGVHLQRYKRQWVSVTQADGQPVIAVTYFARATQRSEAAPSERYRQLLVAGAQDAGVSYSYTINLLRHIAQLPDREC